MFNECKTKCSKERQNSGQNCVFLVIKMHRASLRDSIFTHSSVCSLLFQMVAVVLRPRRLFHSETRDGDLEMKKGQEYICVPLSSVKLFSHLREYEGILHLAHLSVTTLPLLGNVTESTVKVASVLTAVKTFFKHS